MAILRWPPAVLLAGIVPESTHRLIEDSLTPIAWANAFGLKTSFMVEFPVT
jgi:hypothetical protein